MLEHGSHGYVFERRGELLSLMSSAPQNYQPSGRITAST